MLNRIIKLSLRNRLVVLLGAVLLLIAGLYTAKNTDVDVFPDLNAPTVVVMTEANGMAPEEVERLVTFPIETAVNGATGVRRVRSSSTTGFSVVWVEFDWGTDIYRARQIVSEKTAVVEEMLPDGVGSPTLGPQSSILGELMFVSLTADSTSLQDLRTIADWTVRPRLLATGGVAQVSVLGGEVREYQILLNPGRMRHYGVSLDEVCEAVDGMNGNVAGGILYEYGNEYIIRGVLASDNVGTLAGSLVKTTASGPVLLGNVAEVKIGNSRPKMGTASHDGKPCVMVTVTKQPNTSTVDLTAKIDTVLMELGKTLPRDVKVSSDIYRQERFINSSIDNVMKSLYEGGLFVVIVLFLFLMNVRATVISLITIPLSLLVSVLTLHLLGLTINTMSLGGMAIAIGSLVDDAIVDVENVYRRLRENSSLPPGFRQSTLTVIFNASKEVRLPILNSTLIIVASFVPLFFLSGMEGRLLVPLGIAFVTALGASTLVALTLTPVLCSYLLAGRRPGSGKLLTEPYVARKLKTVYGRLLGRALTRHRQVLAVTAVLTVVAIVGFATLGRSFLPPFNEGSFTIGVSTLPGISLEESDRIGHRVEEALLAIPEVQTVGRKTGRAELDEHALGVNDSELEVPFVLGDRSKQEVMDDIRARLAAIPGIAVEVGAPVTHRIDAMLSGTRANIAIKVFGPDLGTLYSLGKQIEEAVKDIDGIADLNVERQVERPQLRIEPRREMLARYGVTLPQFARMVGVLLGGQVVSQVYEGEKSFDLTLKVADADRMTAADIAAITVDANGAKVPLGTLANITSAMGPNTINRENVARKLVVSANVSGRDLLGVVNDIRERIDAEVAMPEDYHVEYGGQFESERTASRTLLVTSVFSIAAIFLLLFNEFRSVRQASVILLNLPLALIGGVLVLWLSGGVVSIPATIGFISLFGIATRNGMLLVSRYNDLRAEGYTLTESVMHGSIDRLNPILMTALSSALALVPMALGGELPGNEIQSPMAKVILGGLFTSTLLNAFIIPIMYLLINRQDNKK
ncbi:MAG: efflux RND transporter permease subunit [Prevotella sp.]|nr:efflux RND transporter permease subunit [Prevotella sp.]MDD6671724.1 efflux RND transporter permease subunit [Prevotella sp.]MDY3270974.1 efflux RND transporter permease subunit [Prevotella sp.]MDY5849931.1 efflux RND transporter permease subunit [Prevotella sp.]